MITLSATDDGTVFGTIGEDDLQMLREQLEEEDSTDTDYFVSRDTIDLLREKGAGAGLLDVLERAVGDTDGVEVAWRRE